MPAQERSAVVLAVLLTFATGMPSLAPTCKMTLLSVSPQVPAPTTAKDSVRAFVRFRGGSEVLVTNVQFEYEYGESDEAPKSFALYIPRAARFADLWLTMDPQSGVSLERQIRPIELKRLVFGWMNRLDGDLGLESTRIEFSDGRVLETRGLRSGTTHLSPKSHVYGSCRSGPCIHLVGIGEFAGGRGQFKCPLNNVIPSKDAVVDEIRFESSTAR